MKIRTATSNDFDEILYIDRCSHYILMTKEYLYRQTKRNDKICVLEDNSMIVGFIDYKLYKGIFNINKLAIKHDCRKKGYGSYLIRNFKNRLSKKYRHTIDLIVDERLLPGQLFLKNRKFEAKSKILKNYYETHDAYCMSYSILNLEV
jgi:ribosomal protein S18 acetylase RimI-like enzyme